MSGRPASGSLAVLYYLIYLKMDPQSFLLGFEMTSVFLFQKQKALASRKLCPSVSLCQCLMCHMKQN